MVTDNSDGRIGVTINGAAWTKGFQDAYHRRPAKPGNVDDLSYASGRVEGEALRQKHQQEFEQALFDGARMRPPAA